MVNAFNLPKFNNLVSWKYRSG